MGVAMPLLKGRGHSPVEYNRETKEEVVHQSPQRHYMYLAMIFLNHFNSHSLIVTSDP
jgi:hypothetical protein